MNAPSFTDSLYELERLAREAKGYVRLVGRAWEPEARLVVLLLALDAHEDLRGAMETHARTWPWLVRVDELTDAVRKLDAELERLGDALVEVRVVLEIHRADVEAARLLGLPRPRSRVGLA